MFSALVLLLVSQAPAAPPVRVWLGSNPPQVAGAHELVYVQTSSDGHLVVLHARPDGRVEVLFPEDPASDPFVHAGTYEIRGLTTSASAGRGTVVAALSPDPIWFGEFVRRSDWDAASLAGTGPGADPEALLTDIVQRMLGDGSFNYDLTTYAVLPRSVTIVDASVVDEPADAVVDDAPPQTLCIDCSYILPLGHSPGRRRRRAAPPASEPTAATSPAIAVYSVHRPLMPAPLRVPQRARTMESSPRRRVPEPPVTVAPRPAPAVRAVPLVARARSAAALAMVMVQRSQLLTRTAHGARRRSSADLVPVDAPAVSPPAVTSARAFVAPATTFATAGLVAAPATIPATTRAPAPAPVGVPSPRVVASPAARIRAGAAGPSAAATPAAAQAGGAAGVGLGAVRTAGWRHR